MTCEKCEMIEERKGDVVYSDPHAHVVLPEDAAAKGHVRIYTREHAESLDDIDHDETQHLFKVATIVASMLFENLGAQGTNVIMNEGSTFGDHLHIDVVTRGEDDGMNFRWDAERMDEGKLEDAQKRIKDKADLIGHEKPEKGEPSVPNDKSREEIDTSEDNPMIDHIRKLP